jgi:hypothetical protein
VSRDSDSTPAAEKDGIDRRLDESLSALSGAAGEAPPIGSELARELAGLKPATTRMPRREWAGVLVLSLFYGIGILAWMGVRDDVHRVPAPWLWGIGTVWLASFLSITWLVLVPPRGHVMPRWRWAVVLAVLSSACLITAGLLRPPSLTATGTTYAASVSEVIRHSPACLRWGLTVAVIPVVLTALAVRGAIPVGSRWVAAAIGAAGGALGGLSLHLHCPISERFHVGLVHGGLILVAASLSALVARVGETRLARRRDPQT